jgi:hypothetical protein
MPGSRLTRYCRYAVQPQADVREFDCDAIVN